MSRTAVGVQGTARPSRGSAHGHCGIGSDHGRMCAARAHTQISCSGKNGVIFAQPWVLLVLLCLCNNVPRGDTRQKVLSLCSDAHK